MLHICMPCGNTKNKHNSITVLSRVHHIVIIHSDHLNILIILYFLSMMMLLSAPLLAGVIVVVGTSSVSEACTGCVSVEQSVNIINSSTIY